MGRLAGRVAVVTGGGSGIGAAAAERLALEGAAVVVADIDAAAATRVADGIRAAGGAASTSVTDVGDPTAVGRMIDGAVDAFGGLDVLFNNAAALDLRERDHATADVELDVWERQLAVNLTGPLVASRAAIPHMVAAGRGSIVHTASAAGLLGDERRTGYAATKAGLIGLSRAIAVQYGKQGVRSNIVAPGQILTPFVRDAFSPADRELLLDAYLTPAPGEPEDVAALVAFLASDESAYITGQVIPIDGGLTAVLPFVPVLRRTRRAE